MPVQNPPMQPAGKLSTLLQFLETDAENTNLLIDTIEEALEEKQFTIANELIEKLRELDPNSNKVVSLTGLAFMQTQQFQEAVEQFETLLSTGNADSAIHFNLAWSRAMLKDFLGALDALTLNTVTTLPQAAMLEVQLLHQLGEFQEAIEKAKVHITSHSDHSGLMAATSVLALDVEDPDLAKACAAKAGSHPDALTTLGTLALGEDKNVEALHFFDKALQINPHGPRTWIGKGLAQLVAGDQESAATNLDHGAELFQTHIGSWIAAGWAHLLQDDIQGGRKRFQQALELDRNFAESHGSLAVIDFLEGDIDLAEIQIKTAIKLDKECFSAIFAQTLILQSQGKDDIAQRIFKRAINTPVGSDGRTIAHSLINMGLSL